MGPYVPGLGETHNSLGQHVSSGVRAVARCKSRLVGASVGVRIIEINSRRYPAV
jgi:hypothetical protein